MIRERTAPISVFSTDMGTDNNRRLYDRLMEYGRSGTYPFHMPGHKRRIAPQGMEEICRMDITEVDGFDNLHDARGILKEAQEFAAALYGAEETRFCVNGSTGAILAAISAVCSPGGRILIARNCHKSVYHAIEINGLTASYIYPQSSRRYTVCEGIYPQDIDKEWIKHPDIQAIVITSPTYEGVVSDIGGICRAAHSRGIPVIVDEAHGAHFPFSAYFPQSALQCGADIVIHSVHKTLPAMTQTALLHVNGDLVDRERLRRMLTIYQSSSPSYILMGSIDACMHLLQEEGEALFEGYTDRLEMLRRDLSACSRIHLLSREDLDPERSIDLDRSKIVLFAGAGRGEALYQRLRKEYGLQFEMAAPDFALAMTSPADDEAGFARLREAVLQLDREAGQIQDRGREEVLVSGNDAAGQSQMPRPEQILPSWQAVRMKKENKRPTEAAGRIAAGYIYLYPPGIPLLVPGERISEETLARIFAWRRAGLEITGICQEGPGTEEITLQTVIEGEHV